MLSISLEAWESKQASQHLVIRCFSGEGRWGRYVRLLREELIATMNRFHRQPSGLKCTFLGDGWNVARRL